MTARPGAVGAEPGNPPGAPHPGHNSVVPEHLTQGRRDWSPSKRLVKAQLALALVTEEAGVPHDEMLRGIPHTRYEGIRTRYLQHPRAVPQHPHAVPNTRARSEAHPQTVRQQPNTVQNAATRSTTHAHEKRGTRARPVLQDTERSSTLDTPNVRRLEAGRVSSPPVRPVLTGTGRHGNTPTMRQASEGVRDQSWHDRAPENSRNHSLERPPIERSALAHRATPALGAPRRKPPTEPAHGCPNAPDPLGTSEKTPRDTSLGVPVGLLASGPVQSRASDCSGTIPVGAYPSIRCSRIVR